MITSVKKSNADKYSYLYEKASEYLMSHGNDGSELTAEEYGGEKAMMKYLQDSKGEYILDENGEKIKAPISSLQEYFSYIQELSSLDMTYTVLPLDEEPFEIDANTRQITVPDAFKANGISVQGDEIAEVVYFKIDRFYDATDLGLKKIYIEWTAPNGDKGVSVPCVVDLDSEPNFIIFGWPLSSAITKTPGQVIFAVRFYTIDETSKKIDYSFATLTQTVQVKESLSYDLTNLKSNGITVDNALNLIKGRFENTTPSGSTTTAKEPIFSMNMDSDPHKVGDIYVEENVEGGNAVTYVSANLGLDADGFTTQSFDAQVSAYSEDAGTITYVAQKLDFDNKTVTDFSASPEVRMIETTDVSRVEGKLYYYAEVNDKGVTAYKLYSYALDEETIIAKLGKKQPIFEKVFAILVDGIGYYTVTATNRVRTAHAKTKSYTMVIPRPKTPSIRTNLAKKDVFVGGEIYREGETYELTLSVDGFTDRGKLTYQWCVMRPGETEFSPIEGATGPDLAIEGYVSYTNETATDAEGNPYVTKTNWVLLNEGGVCAGDGYYHCVIINNLNKEVDAISSDIIKITHQATKPVISLVSKDAYTLSELQGETSLKVSAEIPATSGELVEGWRIADANALVGAYTFKSEDEKIVAAVPGWKPAEEDGADNVSYTWFRYYAGAGGSVSEDMDKAANGTYEINHDVEMYPAMLKKIEDLRKLAETEHRELTAKEQETLAKYEAVAAAARTPEFHPLESGYYFCVAINKYNGTQAYSISRFFTVAEA